MRTFSCPRCRQLVFFENSLCLRCGASLGFDPGAMEIVEVDAGQDPGPAALRRCANAVIAECNWLITPDDPEALCRSCRLTRTRPSTDALPDFAVAEAAKRRLLFQLLELGLPFEADEQDRPAVAFDLLSSAGGRVVTGHDEGLITLDLSESDDLHREQVRRELGEPYRTVLGHFRHEISHYLWPYLVGPDQLSEARSLFGDERSDYAAQRARHYEQGPPPGWEKCFVSAYATMHPWEDWAETFAHYLHIRDTINTADAFGLSLRPDVGGAGPPIFDLEEADVEHEPFDAVIDQWLALAYALNALNRSMGREDAYPFVLAPLVIDKLSFVHRLVTRGAMNGSRRGISAG